MNYIRALAGFGNRKDNSVLIEVDVILSAMTGNPNFPDPVPSLTDVEMVYNDFVKYLVCAASSNGRIDKALKRERKAQLAQLMGELAGYVNYKAKGELSILYSSGFRVFKERKKGTAPGIPTGCRLSDGRVTGETRLDFQSLGRDMTYEYTYAIWTSMEEVQPDSPKLDWEESRFTTRSRNNVIKALPSRSIVFAKVRAINRHGVGDWSAVVSLIVR